MKGKNYGLMIGCTMVIILVILIVLGDLLAPNEPEKINMAIRFADSTVKYPLGTDAYGRCVLSRLIVGTRYSIGLAVLIISVVAIGIIPVGMIAAYKGGFFYSDRKSVV